MIKTLKTAMIFAFSFVFIVLGFSISFTSFCKVNAETIGSTSEGISMTNPTEPAVTIVTVPVTQLTTETTEPIEPAPTQGETGDIKWIVNDDKQLIISKNNTGETCSTGDWYETYIEYETVYTTDGSSFEVPIEKERRLDTSWSKCDYSSVVIEDGVTEIGAASFYGAEFEEIKLPDSIRTINKSAFSNAKCSDKFAFPPNLTNIGSYAFSGSKFDFGAAVLPKSLIGLENGAFSDCLKLDSIDLSQTSITKIKSAMFYNCENLKTVTFPKQLESIGNNAFVNTGINEYIILSKNAVINFKSMGYIYKILNGSYNPVYQTIPTKFIGYAGSTIAEYAAQSDDFTFVPLDDGKGDLNFDGFIDKLDVKLLQECLIGKVKFDDKVAERADLLEDGSLNVFDLIKLKRIILKKLKGL